LLKRHSEVYRSLFVVADMCIVTASWLGAYVLRFVVEVPFPGQDVGLRPYAELLLLILPLWLLLYRIRGLYRPWRIGSLFQEAGVLLTTNLLGLVLLVAISFFLRSYFYSRVVLGTFFLLTTVSQVALRVGVRLLLRRMRRRGFNLRHVLVVGAGELAASVIDRIRGHPEAGLRVLGVLGEPGGRGQSDVRRVPVLGSYHDLRTVVGEKEPDVVLLALPGRDADHLEKILQAVEDEMVSIAIVPDLPAMITLRSELEELDGLPMIALREGPLVGWARVQKRVFDLVVAGLASLVLGPVIAVLALAIRLTSGRPVLFAQERMGLDGHRFRMLKFRTMRGDAEHETGPVWTVRDDPRRTRLGRLLRRTSLDELPQLWNVLRGDMSLVGPRPERPVFIEQFRREIPGYMLRHKMKAGVTGWAQVHGWRGDTSLHERVEHDLYYIQHWSLALDLRILWLTLWRGLLHRNAY